MLAQNALITGHRIWRTDVHMRASVSALYICSCVLVLDPARSQHVGLYLAVRLTWSGQGRRLTFSVQSAGAFCIMHMQSVFWQQQNNVRSFASHLHHASLLTIQIRSINIACGIQIDLNRVNKCVHNLADGTCFELFVSSSMCLGVSG